VAVTVISVWCVLSLLRDHTHTVLYVFDQSANVLNTIDFLPLAILLGFFVQIWQGVVVFFLHY